MTYNVTHFCLFCKMKFSRYFSGWKFCPWCHALVKLKPLKEIK